MQSWFTLTCEWLQERKKVVSSFLDLAASLYRNQEIVEINKNYLLLVKHLL